MRPIHAVLASLGLGLPLFLYALGAPRETAPEEPR